MNLKARKEVIIAAGAVKSPQLLMLSGIGPKNQLQKFKIRVIVNLPVGTNLQDHVGTIVILKLNENTKPLTPRNPKKYISAATYGYIPLNKTKLTPDYRGYNFLVRDVKIVFQYCLIDYGFKREICENMYKALKSRNLLFNIIAKLHPKSKGEIKLRTLNSKDSPTIIPGYCSNIKELEDQILYVKDFLQVLNTKHFKDMGAISLDLEATNCNIFGKGSDDYWRCYVSCLMVSRNHFCGTCSMWSVVDGRLRVYGVQKLRVADASIMPVIPSGGTFIPTVMIGERASVMILEDNK